uniref:Uncharacterized protein n=1 Tax=Lepeophtheirus salmonis TaxID=72036 RepID=A0A0K2UHI3_LEPSM
MYNFFAFYINNDFTRVPPLCILDPNVISRNQKGFDLWRWNRSIFLMICISLSSSLPPSQSWKATCEYRKLAMLGQEFFE